MPVWERRWSGSPKPAEGLPGETGGQSISDSAPRAASSFAGRSQLPPPQPPSAPLRGACCPPVFHRLSYIWDALP